MREEGLRETPGLARGSTTESRATAGAGWTSAAPVFVGGMTTGGRVTARGRETRETPGLGAGIPTGGRAMAGAGGTSAATGVEGGATTVPEGAIPEGGAATIPEGATTIIPARGTAAALRTGRAAPPGGGPRRSSLQVTASGNA